MRKSAVIRCGHHDVDQGVEGSDGAQAASVGRTVGEGTASKGSRNLMVAHPLDHVALRGSGLFGFHALARHAASPAAEPVAR
jgi:hypothetical protein